MLVRLWVVVTLRSPAGSSTMASVLCRARGLSGRQVSARVGRSRRRASSPARSVSVVAPEREMGTTSARLSGTSTVSAKNTSSAAGTARARMPV